VDDGHRLLAVRGEGDAMAAIEPLISASTLPVLGSMAVTRFVRVTKTRCPTVSTVR
jgi:hypothetical protein